MNIQGSHKPYLVYLTHQKPELEERLKNLILNNISNVDVKIFRKLEDIPMKEPLADLVIFDMGFINMVKKSEADSNDLYTRYYTSSIPFLMVVSEEDYGKINLKFIDDHPDTIHDFFNETLFYESIFINRVKVLLNIPKLTRSFTTEKDIVQKNLWMALDYSNLFIIILNKDFKVVLANYQLAKTLGYKNEEDLIGINWGKHIVITEQDLIQHVLNETLKGNKTYEEFTNDIVTMDGKRITVKWFNTLINNNFNAVFSIGVPLTQEVTIDDNIDTVRAYFTDIIRRDRTTINAMKEITMKYSEKILPKTICLKGDKDV